MCVCDNVFWESVLQDFLMQMVNRCFFIVSMYMLFAFSTMSVIVQWHWLCRSAVDMC